jgi:hypothetical protein
MPGARDRLCWSHRHTAPHAAPLQIRARLGSKESGPGLGVANRRVLAPRRAGTGTGRFATPGDKSPPAITGGTCSSVETSQQCTGRARAPLSLRPAACRLEVGHGSGAANGAPRVASPSLGCGSSLVPASGTDQQTAPSPGSLLGLRTQGSGPSESGTCWTRRSKSGSDSGPGIQGHKTWVGGSSVTSQAGQWSRGLLAMERSRPDSEQVAAGAADTTATAGPAGLIRS